jgi:hypothetical protein
MKEQHMKIQFLGTTSNEGACPRAFATDRGTYLLQGARVTDPAVLDELSGTYGGLPDHETVVEIPAGLLAFLPNT